MKNTKIFYLCCFVLLMAANETWAQKGKGDDKETRKKWEEKKKEMSLEGFKQMLDEYQVLKGENEALKQQIAAATDEMKRRDGEVQSLREEMREMLKDSAKVNKRLLENNEVDAAYKAEYQKGLIFKVQAGAFRTIDFSHYDGNNQNFSVEKDGDVNKYVFCYFRVLEEAKNFREYLKRYGVKDAWVVAYKDNVRLPVEEQQKYNQ